MNTTAFLIVLILTSIYAVQSEAPCVKWGNTFDVSIESSNVMRNCQKPDKTPICCAAVDNTTITRGVGASYIPKESSFNGPNVRGRFTCSVSKKYVSSPQEIRELAEADRIELIPGDKSAYVIEDRYHALMKYVTSDDYIRNSTIWLERVKYHMSGQGDLTQDSPADYEYLSRFEFTRTCSSIAGEETTSWVEWIEPIGITARHPFGFGKCRQSPAYYSTGGAHNTGNTKPRVGRSDVDYVLLQSGAALHKQTHTANNKRIRPSNSVGKSVQPLPPNKHYLFDAGTSTFDSSLFWFTCAFSQRGVSFDQVFGWEMTLLEPMDYWRRVPALWKPHWHFHNVPVQKSLEHADSPLRYIQQLAAPGDFVAFKLDIDHPDMEMPIALMLRDKPELFSLVDEFFFELHFRCEVMTSCGWGKRVPAESHGLPLVRSAVLRYFIGLREQSGIRAHIWP